MDRGKNQEYVQAFNQRLVLNVIRLSSPISRAEIARRTQLTPQTISNLVGDLLAQDLVREAGHRHHKRGGKPSVDLELNPLGAYALGLNLDRDRLTGVVVDLVGTVVARVQLEMDRDSYRNPLPALVACAKDLLATDHGRRFAGVGLGIPNPQQHNGATPHTFVDRRTTNILESLEDALALPVSVENNAGAAAIGEFWYGKYPEKRNFLYVYVGLGLGGGILIDGQPHRGTTGYGGEFGRVPLSRLDGSEASPAVVERLEDRVSLRALYQYLGRFGLDVSSPADIDRLHRDSDPHLSAYLDDAARLLAPVLAEAEVLLDPDAVILGGRLPASVNDAFIARVGPLVAAYRPQDKHHAPPLLPATAGDDAAALGVATLPIFRMLTPAHDLSIPMSEVAGYRVRASAT